MLSKETSSPFFLTQSQERDDISGQVLFARAGGYTPALYFFFVLLGEAKFRLGEVLAELKSFPSMIRIFKIYNIF